MGLAYIFETTHISYFHPLRRIASIIYTAWCGIWLLVPFLIVFPIIYICIQRKQWHRFAHRVIQFYAKIFFIGSGLYIQKTYRFKPDTSKAYVFVANHFTYLDIAVGMNIVDNYFAYVGKSSVKKIPLFGYMFAKLHIQVDRSDKDSRAKSLVRGIKAIQSGRSVFIMPEGGIVSTNPPQMHLPLKDGAFIMAVENQVPIVPISYLNFHLINKPLNLMRWGVPRVIFNEPIETKGLTKNDIEMLKDKVYQVIQSDLDAYAAAHS